jgi:hypothetical protein
MLYAATCTSPIARTPSCQVAYSAGDFVWLADDRADRAVLIGSGACLFVDERDTREAHEKQATVASAQRSLRSGRNAASSLDSIERSVATQ